jgi:phosphosulfolactate synthase (CoM biosynthesis protein A)
MNLNAQMAINGQKNQAAHAGAGGIMTIVENKQATLEQASQLSLELLEYIGKKCQTSSSEDDPAEHIYLAIHTISALNARVCLALEQYGKIYGIGKLDADTIHDLIKTIAKETIDLNHDTRQ